MKKNGKKYILKESELKEVVKMIALMEAFKLNEEYGANNTACLGQPYKPIEMKHILGGLGKGIKALPNFLLPNNAKEKMLNTNQDWLKRFYQWLGLNTSGATAWDGLGTTNNG